jgi:hypothetical protein
MTTNQDKRAWHVRAVYALLPNAGWDAIKLIVGIGASGTITVMVRRLVSLRGLPHDSLIDLSIFISCLILFALASILARKSRKAELKTDTTTEQSREPQTESQSVEPLYQWLHDFAGRQAAEIARHVELEQPRAYNIRLTDSIPSINFKFPIRNYSVLPISIDEKISGKIYLDGKELAEPIIVRHFGQDIGFRELNGLAIEQRLTRTEANYLLAEGGKFDFSDLVIIIKGGTQAPTIRPQPLTILERHALVLNKDFENTSSNGNAKQHERLEVRETEPAKFTGIAFEVDTKSQSDVRLREHRDIGAVLGNSGAEIEVDFYILTAQIKVRFENHDIHPRALNRLEVSLIERQNGREIVKQFLEEPVVLQIDPDNNKQLRAMTDFTFEPQRAALLWFHFQAFIQREDAENLTYQSFLRVTVSAMGQAPISQDLDVDWSEALRNATYLRSRPRYVVPPEKRDDETDSDWDKYLALKNAMRATGGESFFPDDEDPDEQQWAERMVKDGLLERGMAGDYVLPRGK